MKSIPQRQEEILREVIELHGELEKVMLLLITLGRQLPPMPEEHKTDQHLIRGCQSKVWLMAWVEKGNLYFLADSNTAITKGLISLLIRVFNGQPAGEVLKAELHFIRNAGLERFIGTQRSNGLASMIRQMKAYATEYCQPESSPE